MCDSALIDTNFMGSIGIPPISVYGASDPCCKQWYCLAYGSVELTFKGTVMVRFGPTDYDSCAS